MVTMWSSFLIIPTLFITIKAVTLLDYVMEAPKDNLIFHSVLTEVLTSKQWHLSESLAGKTQLHGKIQVSMAETHQFEIFYHGKRDSHRLLLKDGSCIVNSYLGNGWIEMLPGVDEPLVNMIIMLGPSLTYRLEAYLLTWTQEQEVYEEEEEVRGVKVISYSTLIGVTLKLIVYFKSDLVLEDGLKNPVRIIFEESKSGSTAKVQKFILDYYSLKSTDIDLDKLVEVTPGYGCALYFQPDKNIPKVTSPQFHLVFTETYQYDDNPIFQGEKFEIFFDIQMNYLRINRGFTGSSFIETLYDIDLGIGYSFSHGDGTCRLIPLVTRISGINEKGSFDLNELFLIKGDITYVGNIYLPDEWPFAVNYWESIRRYVQIDGSHFDKVVTTYYFANETDNYDRNGKNSVPMAVIMKGTNLKWEKSSFYQRMDIHEFQDTINDDEYKGAFQINGCNNDWSQRKSLTLKVNPQDLNGLKFAEQNVNKLRDSIRKLVTNEMNLSPLRIVDIDILFTDNQLKVMLTIIETPRLEDSFQVLELIIDSNVLNNDGYTFHLENAEKCLKFVSSNTELRSVAYCGSTGECIGIKDIDLISKAQTINATDECKIFQIPFGNLNHLRKQIALKDIDQTFKSRIIGLTIELFANDKVKYEYKIDEIVDISVDPGSALSRQAFTMVKEKAKLNVNQPFGLIKFIHVNNYGDCYRSCEQSDQLDCSIFSYCYNDTNKSYECLVSSGLNITDNDNYGEKFILNSNCTIYKRNLLFNYKKLPSNGITDWINTWYSLSVEDCAVKCSQSTDCHLFQYCNLDSICFLPDKSAKNHEPHHQVNNLTDCDIYLLKASNHFQITGSKLVTDVIHSETELDLDQCAATCYKWRSSESQECRSFNFCAKGQSNLCQLSQVTVHDKNIQLTDSTNCINYEIISTNQAGQEKANSQVKVSGFNGGSIAIIILFIAIGLGFGSCSPFAFKRLKSKYLNNGFSLERLR